MDELPPPPPTGTVARPPRHGPAEEFLSARERPRAPRHELPQRFGRPHRFLFVLGPALGALGGTILTLGILAAIGELSEPSTSPTATPTSLGVRTSLVVANQGTVPTVAAVAEAALPSIVSVEVEAGLGAGSGSGVVYREDGYVLTNDHVITGADAIRVVFADGVAYPAELIGTDPLTDLAVLFVKRPDLTAILIGASDQLSIGDGAVAVGNPLGLLGGPSVTAGVISAFDRTLEVETGDVLFGLIQTDAPITRGSSGGALLDSSARLIGITTAVGVSDVGAEGLGFAIPIELVTSVADDLIDDGQVFHAYLGIEGMTVSDVGENGASTPLGTAITGFTEASAAQAAGARLDDVVIAIDGQPVTTLDGLIAYLRLRRADDTALLTISRDGKTIEIAVELGRYPEP